MDPGKMVPGRLIPGKSVPGKISFNNCCPSQECYEFWTTFLFLSIDSTTHTKRCVTFTLRPYIHQTVEHERCPGRFVVEFSVFIDRSHSNIPHTHHDARQSPHNFLFPIFGFVSEFWVYCRVLDFIDWSHSKIPHTYTTMLDANPTIFCFWVFRGPFFRESYYVFFNLPMKITFISHLVI